MRFIVAMFAAVLPRRLWPDLEKHFPVRQAAAMSGIATFMLAMAIGIPAYWRFAETNAGHAVDLMLEATGWRPPSNSGPLNPEVAQGAWGLSFLSPITFAFFTPLGLLSLYLALTGGFRAVSVYVDDPRGDPLLTTIDTVVQRSRSRRTERQATEARRQLEGQQVADRVMTGAAAGIPDAAIVVVTSHRKREWVEGAFVITQEKWYRIGPPVERHTPNGLRTLYPLNEAGAMEVLRKGIRYELPRPGG